MKLFFDCETTGLPRRKWNDQVPIETNLEAYESARLVSICWILVDPHTNSIIQQEYYIIKPDNFEIPKIAADIHGISTEYAHTHGTPIDNVLERLHTSLKRATHLIAYNVSFDYNVIKSEIIRYNKDIIATDLECKTQECCMALAKEKLKLQKFIKLTDLHERLFDVPFDNAHNAIYDTIAAYKCYNALVDT